MMVSVAGDVHGAFGLVIIGLPVSVLIAVFGSFFVSSWWRGFWLRAGSASAVCRRQPGVWQRANLLPMKLIFKWLLSAAALLCVAYLYSGVVVSSFGAALIAAFVIGLFNMVLRPVLVVLTLPVTVVTLGLFLFVINALMFWAAAGVLDGFHVRDFSAALWGSLIYSVLGLVIDSAFQRLFFK